MRKFRLLYPLIILFSATAVLAQSPDDDLLAAVRKSDLEKAKTLLAKGANVNAKSPYGATPLFFACDRQNVEMVRLLLENGADVNVKDTFYGATPLGWALGKNNPQIIRLLIEQGAKETAQALNFGVNGNHPDVVRVALEKGSFKPEDLSKHLRTANEKGHHEIAELLKKAGAVLPAEFRVDAATLKLYEGTYKDEQRTLEVKVKEGKLTATLNNYEMKLIPVRQHTFDVQEQDGQSVSFNLEGEKVIGLTVKFQQGQIVLKKGEAK